MFHIADYADDLAHLLAFIIGAEAGLDPFSDHVLPREKLLRETLVHDDDRRGVHLIVLIENASLPNRNPHRFEIIGRNDPDRSAVRWPSGNGCSSMSKLVTMLLPLRGSGTIVLADSTPGRARIRGRN